MTDHDYERELGGVQATLKTILETMQKKELSDEHRDNELSAIKATLSELRGAWKVLVFIGGAAGVIGGAAVKFVPWLLSVPK